MDPVSDPIRARLDEHHMHRGHCIGCVRRFGGNRYECEIRRELDALRAVLDLCDPLIARPSEAATYKADIRDAIASALGVEPE